MPMGTYVVLVPIYVLVLVPVQHCNGPAVLCCVLRRWRDFHYNRNAGTNNR